MVADPNPTLELVRFGRLLRAHGVNVVAPQVIAYVRTVASVDPADIGDLYWVGRITLVNRQADLRIYDRVFEDYFVGSEPDSLTSLLPLARAGGDEEDPAMVSFGKEEQEMVLLESGEDPSPGVGGPTASASEVLRTKNFDRWTEDEFAQLVRLLPRLRLPQKLSRRTRPSPQGARIDLRRSIRHSLQHGGELIELRRRRRVKRTRPVVLIVDVSGSMTGFSRALVQFAYGTSRASQRVEVFCFGTRLTRLTDAMRIRDPDSALEKATDLVMDWDGGTRIGESLATYVTRWGKYRFNRGAMVIICSDGLELGEPIRLAWAMQRLSRQAHAIIWVNPLAGDPKFQPLARGLVAALPFVDELVAGNNMVGLEDLARVLEGWAA